MGNKHLYTLNLKWIGESYINSIKNDRLYEIAIPGKSSFKGSADQTFHGDATLLNPEDMLLSALSSCHMMSYFYVCRQNAIEIISYQDQPLGTLQVNSNGSGQFSKIILKPLVIIKSKLDLELAISLHSKAKSLCFIGNSCNFPIEVEPIVEIE
ncbi:OsmC family protein [Aurantibacter sp.]|uniref:OsmC family protein n=1 Tax=Aurantibacter sp. TaxID=2807103 RepID=UPI0035C81DA1